MNLLNNERGGILPYVLVILMILVVFTPVLLSMTTNSDLIHHKRVHEKISTFFAVSSMQTFINYPGDQIDQRQYLIDHYGRTSLSTPEGIPVDLYQYAVSYGDTDENYSNRLTEEDLEQSEEYRAVILAIAGDHNHDRKKGADEPYFYQKRLALDVMINSGDRTSTPIIDPVLKEGMTKVRGISEAEATIVVKDENGNRYEGTADEQGNFIVSLGRQLVYGETLIITATAPGKLTSIPVTVTVYGKNDPNDGYVKIIDDNGNIVYVPFREVYYTPENMVVTRWIGNHGVYETEGVIRLTAEKNLTLEETVEITTHSNGSGSGLHLTSNTGNVWISGTKLVGTGNSNHSIITITAAGDIHLENAELKAERDIILKAGGSIYAKNAKLTSLKNNAEIQLILDDTNHPSTGVIQVENLILNKNGSADPANGQICGTLAPGSTLNSKNIFPACN